MVIIGIAGNVSEMPDVNGQSRGGNWNSTGYYLQIDAENEYGWACTKGSPMIGFRHFMEVLEN